MGGVAAAAALGAVAEVAHIDNMRWMVGLVGCAARRRGAPRAGAARGCPAPPPAPGPRTGSSATRSHDSSARQRGRAGSAFACSRRPPRSSPRDRGRAGARSSPRWPRSILSTSSSRGTLRRCRRRLADGHGDRWDVERLYGLTFTVDDGSRGITTFGSLVSLTRGTPRRAGGPPRAGRRVPVSARSRFRARGREPRSRSGTESRTCRTIRPGPHPSSRREATPRRSPRPRRRARRRRDR